MGPDYLALLKRGFDSPWADSHPRPGKASGAYMAGYAYDVHPYLLLNHNGDYESLSTLAHEWGHAVHTLLADANQPFDKAGYATFIAESASIGNEMLLSDYMVAHAQSRDEKMFYLYQSGLVNLDEALRGSSNPDEFRLRLAGIQNTTTSSREEMEKSSGVGNMSDVITRN